MDARSYVSAYGPTIDVTDLKNHHWKCDKKSRATETTVKTLVSSLRMTKALAGGPLHRPKGAHSQASFYEKEARKQRVVTIGVLYQYP